MKYKSPGRGTIVVLKPITTRKNVETNICLNPDNTITCNGGPVQLPANAAVLDRGWEKGTDATPTHSDDAEPAGAPQPVKPHARHTRQATGEPADNRETYRTNAAD